MLYRGMDRVQLDAAYNNSAAVPERDAIVVGWASRSAAVRRERTGHFDLRYGETPRERLDLFLATDPKAPTLAFIHGGYWQSNDKETFAFLAEGAAAERDQPRACRIHAGAGGADGPHRRRAAPRGRMARRASRRLRRRSGPALCRRAFRRRPPDGDDDAAGRGPGRPRDQRPLRSRTDPAQLSE